jgi:hypothetical protein
VITAPDRDPMRRNPSGGVGGGGKAMSEDQRYQLIANALEALVNDDD